MIVLGLHLHAELACSELSSSSRGCFICVPLTGKAEGLCIQVRLWWLAKFHEQTPGSSRHAATHLTRKETCVLAERGRGTRCDLAANNGAASCYFRPHLISMDQHKATKFTYAANSVVRGEKRVHLDAEPQEDKLGMQDRLG
jgi:hypothetical protein